MFLSITWLLAGGDGIDREIARIMAAPPEKRVELMNAFKKRLFEMNQRERAEAIRRLRGRMSAEGAQRRPPETMPPTGPKEERGRMGSGTPHASPARPPRSGAGAGAPVPPPAAGSAPPRPGGGGGHPPRTGTHAPGAGGGPGAHHGMPGMGRAGRSR
jgi:hypothetical protein